jgi:hypothetical protein
MTDNTLTTTSGEPNTSLTPSQAMAQAYAGTWGANGLFVPGTPMQPIVADDEKPRVFDYPIGINLYLTPRTGYGLLPFSMLRNFANSCDAVRIVIEAIKREIRAMEWDIILDENSDDDDTDYTDEITRLREFWKTPDGATEFDAWCNSVLDDLLVVDAVSLWTDVDGTSTIVGVEQIDGTTIRPLLDQRGRTPRAPIPAYMQAVKGMNWQWFSADRLLYRPFNTSAGSPYGMSPIEFLLLRINETLRRQYAQTTYWDTTNIPEAFAFLPAEWSPDQIEGFQTYIDNMLAGNVGKLRRLKFLPSPGSGTPVHEFRRPDAQQSIIYDEWMMRMTCWAFGFLPSELGLMAGRGLGGKGFSEGQENSLFRFGIGPLVQYLQNLFSGIVKRQTKAPLVWRFKNVGPEEDKKAEFDLDDARLRSGVVDINVLRAKAGQELVPNAKPFIVIGTQAILLQDLFADKPAPIALPTLPAGSGPQDAIPPTLGAPGQTQAPTPTAAPSAPADKPAAKADHAQLALALDHWREKARRRLGDGKAPDCEPPALSKSIIPEPLQSAIRSALVGAKTATDIIHVFNLASNPVPSSRTIAPRSATFPKA